MNDRTERAWRNIHAMRSTVEGNREEAERLRRLPDPVAEAFRQANLHRLLVPEDLGGEGLDPITYFEMVEELSFYDGSAGWNLAVTSPPVLMLGTLPLERSQLYFRDPEFAFSAAFVPSGRAQAVDGGFRVTAKWGFLSGIHQAKWLLAGSAIYDGDVPRDGANGQPQVLSFVIPAERLRILDTWHTGGMRGTGSEEAEADDLFIPSADAFQPFARQPDHRAPIFRVPGTLLGMSMSAVPLGVARRALEALKELGKNKYSKTSRVSTKDVGSAQYAVAKSEALLESSHAYVRDSFQDIWNKVIASEEIDMSVKARARRSYVHAAESAQEAVKLCYQAAGTNAIFEAEPFEQALRDVFAASTHAALHRSMMEMAGKVAFGGAPSLPAF